MSELVLQPELRGFEKRKSKMALKNENSELLEKITKILIEIECLNNRFNSVVEPDLIDSCIYEINALHMKYTYYVKLCKERGVKS